MQKVANWRGFINHDRINSGIHNQNRNGLAGLGGVIKRVGGGRQRERDRERERERERERDANKRI